MTMNVRTVLYCLLGGLSLTMATAGAGHFGWWWLSGAVLSAAFVPVARFGPRGWWMQFGVTLPCLFVVGSLCTASEVAIFFPGLRWTVKQDIVGGFVMYTIVAAALASLAKLLKLTEEPGVVPAQRSAWTAGWMVLLSGFAYVVYYLIFGSITYTMFTRQYYPEGADLARSMGLLFWLIELARGVLMTLVVVPVIYTLRMRRWPAAIAVGVLLWVAGGLAPLLVPNALMGSTQRFIHIVEILTQNAALGVTAVLLLRPARSSSNPSELATADTNSRRREENAADVMGSTAHGSRSTSLPSR
jgi:hypothetical protein